MKCSNCIHFVKKTKEDRCLEDGWCGDKKIAPVSYWYSCKAYKAKQVSIFDYKTVAIKYSDSRGIRHIENISAYDLKTAVEDWREKHEEFYFLGLEEV